MHLPLYSQPVEQEAETEFAPEFVLLPSPSDEEMLQQILNPVQLYPTRTSPPDCMQDEPLTQEYPEDWQSLKVAGCPVALFGSFIEVTLIVS